MTDALEQARLRMREEQRRKNREAAPNLAALMDEVREKFGEFQPKLIWGVDLVTGHEVGEKPDESNAFRIPKDYFPCERVETKRKGAKR